MLEAMARRGHHLSSNRVVQDDGGIAAQPDEAHGQRRQLESEGVPFDDRGRVDLVECPPVVL